MNIDITPFQSDHLADAADLFISGYKKMRKIAPTLPARYENQDVITKLIDNFLKKSTGVVAIKQGRVVGYLVGKTFLKFRGNKGVFIPDYAHAAEINNQTKIYDAMYARLSHKWVQDEYRMHVISMIPFNNNIIDSWFWLGFGMIVVDSIRDLSPVALSKSDYTIKRADKNDVDAILDLRQKLNIYIYTAPIFRPFLDKLDRDDFIKRLGDPNQPFWLVYDNNRPVAFLKMRPPDDSAASIIQDEKTIAISLAFAEENYRDKGVGTILLHHAIEWARSHGYTRCSVDFESANLSGSSFWNKYFTPICLSFVRHIDRV